MTKIEKIILESDSFNYETYLKEINTVSDEEKEAFINHLLNKRNLTVINELMKLPIKLINSMDHPILLKAAEKEDKELLLAFIKNNSNEDDDDEIILMEWIYQTKYFNLILSLDLENVGDIPQQRIIYLLLKEGYQIDENNQIISSNSAHQKILDYLNTNGNSITSEPIGFMYSLRNSKNFKEYKNFINKYIDNDNYIAKIPSNSNSLYELNESSTIKEKRQFILNEELLEVSRNRQVELLDFLLEKGAQANYKNSRGLQYFLENQLFEEIQLLVNFGAEMEQYKDLYLVRNIFWGRVDIAKYLISFYENKQDAIKQIKNYNLNYGKGVSSKKQKEIQIELLNHIEKIYLENKLQKSLNKSEKENFKIKL